MTLDETDVRGILQIDSELNKIQDVDILLERILLEARKMLSAEAGTIYVKDGDLLHFRYAQNALQERSLPPGQKLPYSGFTVPINDKSISGYVAMTGEILNIPDVYNLPAGTPYSYGKSYDLKSGYRTQSMLTVPLKTNVAGLLGVIQVLNAKNEKGETIPFATEDEPIISHFAANATSHLMTAQFVRRMILRMNNVAQLKDSHETGAHVNRVASYASEIYNRWAAKRDIELSVRERTMDTLKLAAMLHDVGKVGINDLILKKPARFSPEERTIMEGHTFCGARLFTDDTEYDRMAADIALTHHENWDGTGYPGKVDFRNAYFDVREIEVEGVVRTGEVWHAPALETDAEGNPRRLKGEEIPLAGRIVAVADVFDALCSRRVYKEKWEASSVYDELRKLSGSKFDPEVIEAFFDILPTIEAIQSRFPDTANEDPKEKK
jgi:HD-GYP domain-containing protein (c-di-GMP phosphodiesterase class II)